MPELPIPIHIHQRIIQTIAVPVEALRKVWHLHVWVRAEETAQDRVIQAGIHVDKPELRKMFMTRVATS